MAKPLNHPDDYPFTDKCEVIQQYISKYKRDSLSISDIEYLKMQAHLGIASNQLGCAACQKLYLEDK